MTAERVRQGTTPADKLMSVCIFIAADCELPEKPHADREHFVNFDTEDGKPYDGDPDDEYALYPFADAEYYSGLRHGAELEWNYYTPGRAGEIIAYIGKLLSECDRVELWKVWLTDWYEYDERPRYRKSEVSFGDLTVGDIEEITETEVWTRGQKRPTYHCLTVRK